MYDQSIYAPNATEVQHRYASNSDLTRARLGAIQIFIHGGAWRVGMARDYCFPADLFVAAGAHFLVPNFAPV
jgi:arylformamidase